MTVIAIWTKTKGIKTRRYALWSNGWLITQLDAPLPENATPRDVPREWFPTRRIRIKTRHNFVRLHRILANEGYDSWMAPRSVLEEYLS